MHARGCVSVIILTCAAVCWYDFLCGGSQQLQPSDTLFDQAVWVSTPPPQPLPPLSQCWRCYITSPSAFPFTRVQHFLLLRAVFKALFSPRGFHAELIFIFPFRNSPQKTFLNSPPPHPPLSPFTSRTSPPPLHPPHPYLTAVVLD